MAVPILSEATLKDLKTPLTRLDLLGAVKQVLDLAILKINNKYTKNREKIQWSRVITQAVSSGNSVLKDDDIDKIIGEIKNLRELIVK